MSNPNYPSNLSGMRRHRKSGHTVSEVHFTGKKGGKKQRRKGKELTKKQRKMKRGMHTSKYKNKK